jgi:hypothetical protein
MATEPNLKKIEDLTAELDELSKKVEGLAHRAVAALFRSNLIRK